MMKKRRLDLVFYRLPAPVRRRLTRWNMYPLSRVGQVFWICFLLALVFWALTLPFPGTGFATLARVNHAIAKVLADATGIWMVLRWVRQTLLWRVRNRLMVTYLFIGGAPILLLTSLGLIMGYFLSGQFATFLASADLEAEVNRVGVENRVVASHIAHGSAAGKVDLGAVPELRSLQRTRGRQIELFNGGADPVSVMSAESLVDRFTKPAWLDASFRGIVVDHGRLYFRAADTFEISGSHYTLVSSEPLNSAHVASLLNRLGEAQIRTASATDASFTTSDEQVPEQQKERLRNASPQERARMEREISEASQRDLELSTADPVTTGSVPVAANQLDRQLSFLSPIAIVTWESGIKHSGGLLVTTRPSVLYARLFSASTSWADNVRIVLIGTAAFFAFLELFALFIGVRLTRSITHAVSELYEATQRIERGDLQHRIIVRSNDQLAALEGSFNQMSASLDRLLLEQLEKERMQSELQIAQEVQEQLFPRAHSDSEYLELYGVCRPARSVSGDYYDFLQFDDERSGIAVGDISGKGISAALLMATIQSAVRAYEFGREIDGHALAAAGRSSRPYAATMQAVQSPAHVMWLLNRHLYHSTPIEKYATLFLGVYDGSSRRLTYANGGHLPPILVRRDGSVERLTHSGMVIGLFEDVRWEDASVTLAPGDLVVAYSDGVTEPENEFGEFGDERLIAILREHRGRPLEEISAAALDAVTEWIGEGEQPDDVTLVLARARC